MSKRVASVLLLVVASGLVPAGGCRVCSDCTDYSSPLANSPYAGTPGRAGSAFNGTVFTAPAAAPLEATPPASPVITQPPGVVAPVAP